MEKLKVETTQHVEFDFIVAGIGDRVLATLVDWCVLFCLLIAVFLLNSLLINFLDMDTSFSAFFFLLFFFIPYLFYDLIFEIFMNGQSIGKKVRKIKVVKTDGTAVSIGSYFLRWLFRLIDMGVSVGSLGVITVLINGKGQRLGDIAAGTAIVYIKPQFVLKDTIFTVIPDDFKVTFADASKLTEEDIITIREVLDIQVEERNTTIRLSLSNKLKYKFEAYLNIKSDLPSQIFLSTLLKDYNFLNGKSNL